MGTLVGHLVPGTFFMLFGAWFTYRVYLRYFTCLRAEAVLGDKHRARYRNTASFRCGCCPHLPLEGILKIAAAAVGMTGEFATAFEEGQFKAIGNAQHMSMFFFFGLNGVLDVLTHYRMPLPPDMDFVSAALALSMEALLFYYHLHGRSPMDVQVHMLLFYVVVAGAVAVVLEMCQRTNVLPALGRAYFTLLQGTWFYQVGFVLYPPWDRPWNQHDHSEMMIITLIFTWHNAIIFVFMTLAGTVIYFHVKALPTSALYHNLYDPYLYDSQRTALSDFDSDHTKNILQDSEEEEEEV
ncbi:transmembrane protein 45B [Procambarus clarkii]|uniref:transmembrane protein 45B n=1 Tax=Procambarus clarkii TaxID=6728 RepID=UPI001E6707FA|nr:transmembrane protein 45B-like [Procambarus clarkii]XP_045604476.1 transmembrane protein 45B-like [Procambarus clarkii]XP_045604477.1 transmembrane protein 45B-like [Procambarus clarkii]